MHWYMIRVCYGVQIPHNLESWSVYLEYIVYSALMMFV